MLKRTLSWLLIFAMLCPLFPVRAQALEQSVPDQQPIRINSSSLEDSPVLPLDEVTDAVVTEEDYRRIFQFTPEFTDAYTFCSLSDDDTYGMLAGPDGIVLYGDDDSGEGYNFSITAVLKAGVTYYLSAEFYYGTGGVIPVKLTVEHQVSEIILQPATCTDDGVKAIQCEYCGEGYTEVIPAGHDWDATGTCRGCGEVYLITGSCGDDLTWALDWSNTLTISGTGQTWDFIPFDAWRGTNFMDIDESQYNGQKAPWWEYVDQIEQLVIEPGVTGIGFYTFWGLGKVRDVVIPEGVTTVKYGAFSLCHSLTSITFPATLWDLGACFDYTYSLTSVYFHGSMPKANTMILADQYSGLTIYYYGSTGDWASVGDYWYLPYNVQFYDMEQATPPEDVYFTQSAYTLLVGQSVLTENTADEFVQKLLTIWRSEDPSIAAVTPDGRITGLRPGSTTVTAQSADGIYQLSCQVTVETVDAPDSSRIQLEGQFQYNQGYHNYGSWNSVPVSYLHQTPDGMLERVDLMEPLYEQTEYILISLHDAAGTLQGERKLELELPLFGGFFSGHTYNYLLFGQDNLGESNHREVIRLVRYTKDWQRVDSVSIYGANTIIPFSSGTADFAEIDNTLYLYTCHQIYTASDGLNHQSNMTFVIDTDTMTITDYFYGVMNIAYGYVSHSFNQRVRVANGYVFRADHGDAYPRSVVLTRSYVGGSVMSAHYTDVLEIQGATGANVTGVTMGGMEVSGSTCLIVGSSVDQSSPEVYDPYSQKNIFLTVTDQGLEETNVYWLTNYSTRANVQVGTPQLVKVADEIFLILWEHCENENAVGTRTTLLLVTADGTPLIDPVEIDGRLSDCQPIVTSNGLVTWYSADNQSIWLHQLSWQQLLQDPESVAQAMGHDYVIETTEADCYTGGYTSYRCIHCGDSYTGDEVEPLGHDFEIEVIEPTCISGGYSYYSCKRCGYGYYDDYTDSTPHDMGEWVVVYAPTCYSQGDQMRECLYCGITEWGSIEKIDHTYEITVVEPTCSMAGYTRYQCTMCWHIEDDFTSEPLGHNYEVTNPDLSCTRGGWEHLNCTRCGYSTYGEYVEALGHDLSDWTVIISPTCTETGTERADCSRCDYSETRTVDTVPHTYEDTVIQPTCTEDGYTIRKCAMCGDSSTTNIVPMLGHDLSNWTVIVSPTCTETGTERADCSRCDYSETRTVDTVPHAYEDTVIDPTCTENGYTIRKCAMCGDSSTTDIVPMLGHDLSDWTVIVAPTCTETGTERADCSRCDYSETRTVDTIPHEYTETIVEPTCTEAGYILHKCDCGDQYSTDPVAPLGHDWDGISCTRCGIWMENPFRDVKETDFFFQPVLWAVSGGITAGTGSDTFSPDATCTRAQVVTFLWRACGKPEPKTTENPFVDVPADSYYYHAVLWAVENGITAGTGVGKFSPDDPCTRGQVVTFLWRAMGRETPEANDNPFVDVQEADYYYDPVLWAVENGVTSGTGVGKFSPNDPCTRGQVVTFLYRSMAK